MAKEIERKFLVLQSLAFLANVPSQSLVQGYLHEKGMTSRVRIIDGKTAVLTLKGPRKGLTRDEFEYEIPLADGLALLEYCGEHRLSKTRYCVAVGNHIWEVDVYDGALKGLVTAEVELKSEKEKFARPVWLGPEVSELREFSNKNLAKAKKVPLTRVA